MPHKDLKTAIQGSLRKEKTKVKDRFKTAESVSSSPATEDSVSTPEPVVVAPEPAPAKILEPLPEKIQVPSESIQEPSISESLTLPVESPLEIPEVPVTSSLPGASEEPRGLTKETQSRQPRVRASYSIPASELKLLDKLVRSGLRRGKLTTKSDILRAGLRALRNCPPSEFGRHLDELS